MDSCTQSISAGRCGNHGSPSELRSEIHLVTLNDSHPANGPIPFHIGKPRLLTSLSLSSPCAWSGVCHVSQMRGSHSQISLSWTSLLPFPPQNRAPWRHPSDTSDARRRATVHRFSRFLHSTSHANNTSMRPPGFILPT